MSKMIKLMASGLVALALLAPTAAMAQPAAVIKTGTCSGASDWKLKLDEDNAQIQLEFEVDQNVVGDRWKIKIRHNGSLEFKFRRTTRAPSGSFEARKFLNNEVGRDKIRVRAINLSTGEVCIARASI